MKILVKFGIYDLKERFSIDLTPLKNLSNLETLSLSISQINNITPLSGLVNLKILSLEETGLSNIEPVRGLINLQHLSLSDTRVKARYSAGYYRSRSDYTLYFCILTGFFP
jgi:Leucine-rich repeat (LRR) protein